MSSFDILLWKENNYPKYLKKVLFLLKKWRNLSTELKEELVIDCKYVLMLPNTITEEDDLTLLDLDSKLDKYLTEEEISELDSSPTPSYQDYVQEAILSKVGVSTLDMYRESNITFQSNHLSELHHR